MNAPEAATWIAERLDEDGIDYAIGGALALIAWGAPRATAAVDLSVFVETRELDRVLGALERAGVMVHADAAKEIERIAMFRGRLGRVPVDVFLSAHPHHHAMRERRRLLERLLAVRPELDLGYVESWLSRMVPAGDRRFDLLARLRARA